MKGTIAGQITQIGEVLEIGENGFKKRELILKTVEEHSNFYKIEFTGDKTELLNSFSINQVVKVKCNLGGREYQNDEGQYNVFMSLRGWEIELN